MQRRFRRAVVAAVCVFVALFGVTTAAPATPTAPQTPTCDVVSTGYYIYSQMLFRIITSVCRAGAVTPRTAVQYVRPVTGAQDGPVYFPCPSAQRVR